MPKSQGKVRDPSNVEAKDCEWKQGTEGITGYGETGQELVQGKMDQAFQDWIKAMWLANETACTTVGMAVDHILIHCLKNAQQMDHCWGR